jgi:hypothetical protein
MSARDRTVNKATAANLLAYLKREGVTLTDLQSFQEMVNLGEIKGSKVDNLDSSKATSSKNCPVKSFSNLLQSTQEFVQANFRAWG